MNLFTIVCAAVTGDAPAHGAVSDEPLAILRAQPALIGIALVLLGAIPLFAGWSLVRWASALLVGALTVAVVLVSCHGTVDPALQWTAALSAGALMAVAGFFLVQAVVAVQCAAITALLLFTTIQHVLPAYPVLALASALISAAAAAILGWYAAPYLVIAQCVLNGFLVILAGMIVIVKPDDTALPWLALIVAAVTIIPGLTVQLRAQARKRSGDE